MVFQIWWLTLESHIQLHIEKRAIDTYPDTRFLLTFLLTANYCYEGVICYVNATSF
jgi:hypothetical protein